MEKVEIKGITLDKDRAVFIKKYKALVVSDLHIGIEESSLFGIRIQTKDMLNRILKLIETYKPEKVILNGDIKHSFSNESFQEFREVKELVKEIKKRGVEIIIIKGNHDFYIKNIVKEDAEVKEWLKLGEFLITHGHKLFDIDGTKVTISGDEHPSITLVDDVGIRIKLPVFVVFKDLIITPSFNKLSQGTDIINSTNFMNAYLKKKDLDEGEIFAIGEEEILYFGKIKELREFNKRK